MLLKLPSVTTNMSDSNAIQAKIDELEAEMARTQKNKATNYHLGTLKAKIAKLKSELVNGPGGKSSGTKNAERGFDVTKSGDTRIGLVGKFAGSLHLEQQVQECNRINHPRPVSYSLPLSV